MFEVKKASGWPHNRHLREQDCSLAVVGRPAAACKSIHWPPIQRQSVFYGNVTTTVIKGRQAIIGLTYLCDQRPEEVEVGVDAIRSSELPDAAVELARAIVRVLLE